jgi:ornithine cyclodeaminase/alanine dehydrogenase-like protein (mu-crystallin family)
MLFLKEADVQRLLPMGEAVRLVRESFLALARGTGQNHPRRRIRMESGAVLHSMAGAFGEYFGTKVYSTHPKHGAHFLVALYEAKTGRPLAMMEANHLGQIRTGAASGVAAQALAKDGAAMVAVIGSGFQAATQMEAIAAVRPIREARVWSRSQEKRENFAAERSEKLRLPVRAAGSAKECVEGADIVVTATYAKDPVIEHEWVSDAALVCAMGSNQPDRRELPAELVARAGLIAVDSIEQAKVESGDLLLAWDDAGWRTPRLTELGGVLAEGVRRPAGAPVIFKSNGLGIQDVAVAGYIYEQAMAQGGGAFSDWLYS